MKKLMIAAAAAAVGFGAFAWPEVYEYKASVKNMYLRPMPVTIPGSWQSSGIKAEVYMKYSKTTNLKGWLIMDQDGVTSPTIMTDRQGELGYASPSTGYDFGRNRGFLVVINPGANKAVQHPKILPAILDAKWMDTAFQKLGDATSGLAEGNLYVGGDAVKPVRRQLDVLDSVQGVVERRGTNDIATAADIVGHVPYVPFSIGGDSGDGEAEGVVTNFSGIVAIADYVWTSVYLFSDANVKQAYYNGPNWYKGYPFGEFEYAWDKNLPNLLQTGWTNTTESVQYQKKKGLPQAYFHDTWMNGAGVGKWTRGTITSELCCGDDSKSGNADTVLDSLSGNVKGGLFLCTENGVLTDASQGYQWFYEIQWEDQFNTARITDKKDAMGIARFFAGDYWQNDLWQDGFFEIETTDVIYGTWSIKRATEKFFNDAKPIATRTSNEEFGKLMSDVFDATYKSLPTEYEAEETVEGDNGPETKKWKYTAKDNKPENVWDYDESLWSAIDGAAKNLLPKANTFGKKEIYALSASTHHSGQFALPMITPQFALFYRLVYATDFERAPAE